MNIRMLIRKTSKNIVTKIFKELPKEVECFSVSLGGMGLFLLPYNSFDRMLYSAILEGDPNKQHQEARKILSANDNLLHLLFLRYENRKSKLLNYYDNQEIKIIVSPEADLLPTHDILTDIGLIAKKYPILGYEVDGRNNDPKIGFTVYRSSEHFLSAIEKRRKHKALYDEIRYNYRKQWLTCFAPEKKLVSK
jgi:hypothetical protein